jgi:hypothetical protein
MRAMLPHKIPSIISRRDVDGIASLWRSFVLVGPGNKNRLAMEIQAVDTMNLMCFH